MKIGLIQKSHFFDNIAVLAIIRGHGHEIHESLCLMSSILTPIEITKIFEENLKTQYDEIFFSRILICLLRPLSLYLQFEVFIFKERRYDIALS